MEIVLLDCEHPFQLVLVVVDVNHRRDVGSLMEVYRIFAEGSEEDLGVHCIPLAATQTMCG